MSSSERALRARGFTLIEVLAAVALLAILYTVLARAAIEALRAEGESDRRLEASLLADARLEQTFEGLKGAPVVPPLGHSEASEGDYTLSLDVTPFAPPAEWGIDDPKGPPPVIFAAPKGAAAPALVTVQLAVSWLEGAEPRHVSRTMYAVDFEKLATLAGAAGAKGASGAAGNLADPAQAAREIEEFERQLRESPSELEPP